jgi:predicted Zn-dependent peptidase
MKGCSLLDEGRYACNLLNVVLGSSMSSRLFQEVREKRGLAYSVYSFLNSYEDAGLFGIYAGVGPERVQETLKVIKEELGKLAAEPMPETELKAAKEYLKASMYLGAESTDSRMNRLAKNEFLFNRLIPFEEIEEKLDKVTTQDIQQWSARLFQQERISILLLGPTDLKEVDYED